MKKIVYLYVLDTMADWEVGYVTTVIHAAKTSNYELRTVALTKDPIQTMGGLTIMPDCTINEINSTEIAAILLPGAETWDEAQHTIILDNISTYLQKNILVAAICGATLALAKLGFLNHRAHTSNAQEYLTMFAETYTGQNLYQHKLAVTDGNLITASSAGGLQWAKEILVYLEVRSHDYLEAWYNYYATGDVAYAMKMLSLEY